MHHGMFVDIFVLDDYVKNAFLRRIVTEYITMFDYNAERQYLPENKKARAVYRLTNRLFKSGKIFRWWYGRVFPKLKKDETMCSDIASFTNSHRYDFKREWFGTPRYVDYDEFSFPIPQDAGACLTVCYGDYMTPPPPEQQVSVTSSGTSHSIMSTIPAWRPTPQLPRRKDNVQIDHSKLDL